MMCSPREEKAQRSDLFDEDATELKFLQSKPTCFIILGKPGCGKSTIAKKLSQLWRCELVHAPEIIMREIDLASDIGKKMNEVLLKGEALPTDFIVHLLKEKITSPEVAHYGYVLDGLPTIDDQITSVQEQLEIIKGWRLKPDFIINIKIPDDDLNVRRVGVRVDPYTGSTYPRSSWDTQKPTFSKSVEVVDNPEEEEEDDEKETSLQVQDFPEIDEETKTRLIHAPENQMSHVDQANRIYKDTALTLLEDYMADHDRQYLIEVDGNNPPNQIFQQLVTKLDTFTCRRAIVPVQLMNPDEEELPDEIETEELMRTLASYQNPAPRYRWRRSRWGRFCPVSLKEGNLLQGKPDLAVSFLDKMYVMSSPQAMAQFLKNPRPYLLPPMPSPPCKVAVLGFPFSGKSLLCKTLCQKYNAKIFDMKSLMQVKFAEAKLIAMEKARQEATESAINLVQNKLEQEAVERAEKLAKEREQDELKEDDSDNQLPEQDMTLSDMKSDSMNLNGMPLDESTTDTAEQRQPSPIPQVTESHEEVVKIVAEAMKKAEKQDIQLPTNVYIDALKQALDAMIQERLAENNDSAKDGGWILDGFPENKDQWVMMVEMGIIPDDVIFLIEKTPNLEIIRQRYYETNKEDITNQFRSRLIEEKRASLLQREDEHEKEAEITKEGDEISDENSENKLEKDETSTETPGPDKEIQSQILKEIAELEGMYIGVPSYDAPEFQRFRDILHAFDKEWGALQSAVGGSTNNKPFAIDIKEKPKEQLVEMVVNKIESPFGYKAWDFSGIDLDEEEEDVNAEIGADDDQNEEEEDEEVLRHKKKHFGYTKHYDPVALKMEFVLWPGNPDIAAKYRERIYYFKSTEFREMFVTNPSIYLPKDKPLASPPPRILILGAKGSGKTLQGRILADQLNIFHISFRERLQELILPKIKRKIGHEHVEAALLEKEMSISVEEAVNQSINNPDAEATTNESKENFNLNDEEEAIQNNLVDDEPLPPEILEKIVPSWWKQEPYRSTGFVLEGFPRTVEECQFLIQSGLFPDAALLLMVEDSDIIQRLLPGQIETWRQRRNIRMEKKNAIKDKKRQIKDDKIDARRAVLLEEQQEKRAHRAAQRPPDEEEEEEEEEDIEEILQLEFEDEGEEEEEDEEQEEDVIDRMKMEYGEKFDEDVTKLQAVQEQLEEGAIPRLEIQASRNQSIVQYLVNAKIKPIVHHRSSIFECVYPVSQEVATKMLLTGYKHPSSFGKWDPAMILENGDVIQPSQRLPSFPVLYKQYIYYMSSLSTRNAFMSNPLHYAFGQPLPKSVVPIQMAIVGPPLCGKTNICERFAREFGTVRISVGNSISNVIERQPDSHLAKCIVSCLLRGEVVPDTLAVEAVAVQMLDVSCTTRGYILDGFPSSEQQVMLLNKRGITPVKIIEFDIDGKEMLHRLQQFDASNMQDYPLHKSENIMVVKYASYKDNSGPVRMWYTDQHQNWITINGRMSKWKLWQTVLSHAESSVRQIQDYLSCIAQGEAAMLSDLCITPTEFEDHTGCYAHYCPVCLNLQEELQDCSKREYLKFAVEFRSKYYKTCSQRHMDLFLEQPAQLVPPAAVKLLPPSHLLPKQKTRDEAKSMFPKQIELNGYCPVSFLDGKMRFDALVEGYPNLLVEYKERLYTFESEKKLQKFMKCPETYCDIKLPNKLPPKKQPINVNGLPMLGYLEQEVALSVIKSLTAVGCFKPKFPFLSIKKSALLYVACHLKAFNTRHSKYVQNKFQNKLKHFEEMCKVLTYLGSNMTMRYREPTIRPSDFDLKMGIFLNLQGNALKEN